MTMREQLREATALAQRVLGISIWLRTEAGNFDERWPMKYADELADMANEFLKLKYKK